MSRRVLPPQLQSVGQGLFMRAHESGQLLWYEGRVSFLFLLFHPGGFDNHEHVQGPRQ